MTYLSCFSLFSTHETRQDAARLGMQVLVTPNEDGAEAQHGLELELVQPVNAAPPPPKERLFSQ